jgi:hypothetical protein
MGSAYPVKRSREKNSKSSWAISSFRSNMPTANLFLPVSPGNPFRRRHETAASAGISDPLSDESQGLFADRAGQSGERVGDKAVKF